MTGIVQADLMGKGAKTTIDLHHIVQELDNVHAFLGALALMIQQSRIVQADKCRTADTG